MEFIKRNIKYILLFIFFVCILSFVCFENTSFDFLWSYGFSHALKMGEIPYKDFNTIATPLYIFIMSSILFIKDSFIVFIIFQALLSTILFYFIFKYIGKKGWLLFPVLAFPFFVSFIGTYNFLVFLLLVILFYLEDNNKNDYLIGFILGLLVLSKQTIGGVAVLLNLIFLYDIKRIGKRIIGISIPSILFFIYLLITGSLNSFINLGFLGLFDFGSSNGSFKLLTIISILMVVGIFIYYLRNKDIKCSYLISSFFFTFPLFDFNHFNLFLSLCVLFILTKVNVNEKKIMSISFILLLLILLFNVLIKIDFYKNLEFLNLKHFEYYLVQKKDKKDFNKIYTKYNSYSNSIMISTDSMMFDVASNRDITYFDMPLTGNYGLKGTTSMINKVSNMHDKVFFINICSYKELKDNTQLDYKLIKYVINNSKKIDKVGCYNIYYKE